MGIYQHKHLHSHFLTRKGCYDATPLSEAAGKTDAHMHSGPDHFGLLESVDHLAHEELHQHGFEALVDDPHSRVGTEFAVVEK
jgi:hypothetical protein